MSIALAPVRDLVESRVRAMKTNFCRCAVCLLGLVLSGCKTGAPATSATANSTPAGTVVVDPAITPLPPIDREIGPDGSEIVVAPPADGEAAPRTWSQKIAAFCTPKPPPKSRSNRVYESDNIPYTD